MISALSLRAQIETRFPSAFVTYRRPDLQTILTDIPQIDDLTHGVPLHALTEICGTGKTSVLVSLLARASLEHHCALVDASDAFNPIAAEAAGADLSRLLWVRCGKTKQRLRLLEQAFKVTDMLLQSSGFGLIVVDLSDIEEKIVRDVPASSWFRFSRVVENQPTALVFVAQQPHATSCAGLVLQLAAQPATFSGKLLTNFNLNAVVLRTREKKGVQSATANFSLKAQWA
jgi:recA bacterial DNA recombination protein